MEPQEDNSLDLSRLGRKERSQQLFEFLKSYPPNVSYSERLHDLAARAGITPKNLLQTARRNGWEAKLTTIVEAQQEQEQYAKLLDTAAPLAKEVPFSALAKGIKSLAFVALNASLQYVSTTALLIDFYAKKIAHAIATAGGVTYLDEATAKRVQNWQVQLAYNTKNIQEYIKPTALAALLAMINFSQQLPADNGERDDTAFTIDSLYHKLKGLGMLSAFDNPDKAVEDYGPLPDLDGSTNQRPSDNLPFFQSPENPQNLES